MGALAARFHWAGGRFLAFWGWRRAAAQAFRDALREWPGFTDARARLGQVLLRGELWGEAVTVLGELARARPSDPEVQGDLVLAHGRSGHWRDADLALRRLIDLRPGQSELHVLRGAVLRQMHRPEEAIRSFRWALQLPPVAAHFRLGEALLGEEGWRSVCSSYATARATEGPAPGLDSGVWTSRLHHHPAERRSAPRRVEGPSGPRWPFLARLLHRWVKPANPPVTRPRPVPPQSPRGVRTKSRRGAA